MVHEQAERLEGVRRRAEQALIEARLALGEHARLVPDLERLAREQPFDERVHEHLMLALYRAGRQADALGAFRTIAEASHLLGDTTLAVRVRQLLTPYANLPCTASLAVACFGSAHHALGVTCLTTGDVDAAVDHLRAAVHRNLALAHWPAVALSRRRYAQALTMRARPGDARAAHTQLATATAEARPSSRSA